MIANEHSPNNGKTKLTLPPAPNQKASLFNLIIYTNESRRTAYFQDIVRIVSSQFPCSVIFIHADENAKASNIKVTIGSEKDTKLVPNQIMIDASGEGLKQVPFIIFPYLIPDLPIYLIWAKDPTTEHNVLPHLQKYASRLIFDSECTENLQQFSQNLLAARAGDAPLQLTDMNWARIRGWREVLMQTFDTQERTDQLAASTSIKIVYNSRPSDISIHPETQAFYLQAWLASQLKWTFDRLQKEGRNFIFSYHTPEHPIQVRLQGDMNHKFASEEIMEFEASSDSFLYSLIRRGDTQVIVHCNTLDRCELPFTLHLPTIWNARNFMQEIIYKITSKQYFNMLRLISQLPGCYKNGGS